MFNGVRINNEDVIEPFECTLIILTISAMYGISKLSHYLQIEFA